ncbi:MAG TPA: signal peptidase II, partial [Bacteroidales bacterium]|nr:signal peptidase II [Bacteroidales bacterium]
LYRSVKKQEKTGLIVSVSMIFAGATGNMIDSAFYGMIFSASGFHAAAEFLPEAGGYTTFLHGHVVDMFYFPILRGQYPDWLPFLGGNNFLFFRPVFNVADSAITIGVFILLFFQKKFFPKEDDRQNNSDNAAIEIGEE